MYIISPLLYQIKRNRCFYEVLPLFLPLNNTLSDHSTPEATLFLQTRLLTPFSSPFHDTPTTEIYTLNTNAWLSRSYLLPSLYANFPPSKYPSCVIKSLSLRLKIYYINPSLANFSLSLSQERRTYPFPIRALLPINRHHSNTLPLLVQQSSIRVPPIMHSKPLQLLIIINI